MARRLKNILAGFVSKGSPVFPGNSLNSIPAMHSVPVQEEHSRGLGFQGAHFRASAVHLLCCTKLFTPHMFLEQLLCVSQGPVL